jgi:hypothetical protein
MAAPSDFADLPRGRTYPGKACATGLTRLPRVAPYTHSRAEVWDHCARLSNKWRESFLTPCYLVGTRTRTEVRCPWLFYLF